MAATTSGALKARIESLGYGVPVFRDGPRPGQDYPYVVVTEGVSMGLDGQANGDFGDPDREMNIIEIATVDLVERGRAKTGATTTKNVERYGLGEALAHALHGCSLPAHPAKVHGVIVQGVDRIPLVDNVVRHSIAVRIHRELLLSEVIPA